MADSTIGNLPSATLFTDGSLLVTEQAGAAKKLTGLLLKQFCQNAVQLLVAAATESAEEAATSAEESAADALRAEAAKLAAIAASGHYPYIDSSDHHWMVWDVDASEYVDTGVSAVGEGAITATLTIAVADWNGGTTCTKSATGVAANSIVIVDTSNGNVECTGQGNGTLTFTATSTPTSSVTVKVVIL